MKEKSWTKYFVLDYSFHTFDFDNLARTSEAGKILPFEEKLERKQFIAGIGGLPGSRGGYQWILVYGYCHSTDNKHIGIPARWARSGLNWLRNYLVCRECGSEKKESPNPIGKCTVKKGIHLFQTGKKEICRKFQNLSEILLHFKLSLGIGTQSIVHFTAQTQVP